MKKKTYIWKEGDTKNVVELFNKMWPEEPPMTEEELNKQQTGLIGGGYEKECGNN